MRTYYDDLIDSVSPRGEDDEGPGGGGDAGGGTGDDGDRRAVPRGNRIPETLEAMAPFYDPAFDMGTPGGRSWYFFGTNEHGNPNMIEHSPRTLGGHTFPTRPPDSGYKGPVADDLTQLNEIFRNNQVRNTPAVGEVDYGTRQLSNYGVSRLKQQYGSGMLGRYSGYRDILGRGF